MSALGAATGLLAAIGTYAAVGLGFALAFIVHGVQRIDPAAHGMPWTARLLLIPGAALLWPLLLWKWLRARSPSAA